MEAVHKAGVELLLVRCSSNGGCRVFSNVSRPMSAAQFLLVWAAVVRKTGLLTGTRARNHTAHPEALDISSRAVFLLFLMWAAATLSSRRLVRWLLPLMPLYGASYLDGSEVSTRRYRRGARHQTPSWFHLHNNGWCAFYGWCLEHCGQKPTIKAHGSPPPSDQQCLYGFHPHGIFPFGVQYVVGLGYEATARDLAMPHAAYYDERRMMVAVASFCFYLPGMRELFLHFGMIDCNWPHLSDAISRGNNLVVLPGGAAEAAYTAPGQASLVLKCHRGFVELALEQGLLLVPCYTFGDNDLGLRSWACDDVPVVGMLGRYFKQTTGILLPLLLPARRSCGVTMVVGEAIPTTKHGSGGATVAEVDEIHQRYCDALAALYAAHVEQYGGPNAAREITFVK